MMWIGIAAVLSSVSSAAQSGNATASPAKNAADTKPITVVGCVQNFSSLDVDGTEEHGFLLANVTVGDAGSGAAASNGSAAAGAAPRAQGTTGGSTPTGSGQPSTGTPAGASGSGTGNAGAGTGPAGGNAAGSGGNPTGTGGTAAADRAQGSSAAATPGALAHPSPRGNNYRLQGVGPELKDHVGHRVEVTGMVDPQADAQPDAAKTTSEPRLSVTAVRMISSDCSPRP